jgi:hypothetical protein
MAACTAPIRRPIGAMIRALSAAVHEQPRPPLALSQPPRVALHARLHAELHVEPVRGSEALKERRNHAVLAVL